MSDEDKAHYERMAKFHFGFERFFSAWLKRAALETREHPYKKFAGGSQDRLNAKLIRVTAQYEKNN